MRNQKEEIQNKTNVSIQFSENLAFIRLRVGTLEVDYKFKVVSRCPRFKTGVFEA